MALTTLELKTEYAACPLIVQPARAKRHDHTEYDAGPNVGFACNRPNYGPGPTGNTPSRTVHRTCCAHH
eukprot:2787191-Prymnesium_polylepis.1